MSAIPLPSIDLEGRPVAVKRSPEETLRRIKNLERFWGVVSGTLMVALLMFFLFEHLWNQAANDVSVGTAFFLLVGGPILILSVVGVAKWVTRLNFRVAIQMAREEMCRVTIAARSEVQLATPPASDCRWAKDSFPSEDDILVAATHMGIGDGAD